MVTRNVIPSEARNLIREPGVENRCGASDPSLTLRMTENTVQDDKDPFGMTIVQLQILR